LPNLASDGDRLGSRDQAAEGRVPRNDRGVVVGKGRGRHPELHVHQELKCVSRWQRALRGHFLAQGHVLDRQLAPCERQRSGKRCAVRRADQIVGTDSQRQLARDRWLLQQRADHRVFGFRAARWLTQVSVARAQERPVPMFIGIVEHHRSSSSICQPLAGHQSKTAKRRRGGSALCVPPETFAFETAQIDRRQPTRPRRYLAGVRLGFSWRRTRDNQLASDSPVAALDGRRGRGRIRVQPAVKRLDELADSVG
jgi:hypothetical protein